MLDEVLFEQYHPYFLLFIALSAVLIAFSLFSKKIPNDIRVFIHKVLSVILLGFSVYVFFYIYYNFIFVITTQSARSYYAFFTKAVPPLILMGIVALLFLKIHLKNSAQIMLAIVFSIFSFLTHYNATPSWTTASEIAALADEIESVMQTDSDSPLALSCLQHDFTRLQFKEEGLNPRQACNFLAGTMLELKARGRKVCFAYPLRGKTLEDIEFFLTPQMMCDKEEETRLVFVVAETCDENCRILSDLRHSVGVQDLAGFDGEKKRIRTFLKEDF